MPENSSANTSNISSNPFFQQLVKISQQLDDALKDSRKKDEIIHSLTEQINDLTEQVEAANTTIASLTEQITLMAAQRYAKKSEKRSSDNKKKDDDDSNDSDSTPSSGSAPESDSSKKLNTHRPVKKNRTRKPKPTMKELIERMSLDVEKVVIELDEDKRICEYCTHELIPFGQEHLRYGIEAELPKLRVIEYVGVTYGCPNCHEKAADSNKCTLAPVAALAPRPLLPGSWASASLLALAIAFKTLYQIPTNLLITMFREMGMFSVSSGTLCSWIISAAQIYFAPLFDRLRELLIQSDHIQADETSLRVINESVTRRKTRSFIWQYRTADICEFPIVLFDCQQGRSGRYAAEFLKGFEGTLLVDGYSGCSQIEGAKLANCWVHARRYFIEASLVCRNETVRGQAQEALALIDQLFDIEQDMSDREMNLDERMEYRHEHTLPVVDELFRLIGGFDLNRMSSEKMRKACRYLMNHEAGLRVFLDDPLVAAHNNSSEEAFVSIARGRHNWLFAYSEDGARALTVLSSITKTARRCGLNVLKYLELVMNRFREWRESAIPSDVIESVLPWNDEIRELCGLSV